MNWIEAISKLNIQAQGYVLVTVLETKGSSPRDTGTKMVVSVDESFDTIGGGALEYKSIELAREFLHLNKTAQYTETFNLGKDLKQCCGGVVKVFFEVFPASDFNIVIFGAGHIGKSLIKILEEVDCQVKWFDSRPELFPETVASHIQIQTLTQPELAVESCKSNSYFLVMTHDHALDQQLCETILSRGDSLYCGLIGSATKGLKFRQRLMKKGYNKEELEQLTCPVGLPSLKSKKPMEIAVSISAELLQLRDKQSLNAVIDNSKVVTLGK
ncbi:MAG: xanthine dehydrogenase accessory protein XdhC [Cocleimonas sp.]|nr:xanthine dehydrogenase accessory protein XdhC [Cocleimonas sp.]